MSPKNVKLLPPTLDKISKEHCNILRDFGRNMYYHVLPSLAEDEANILILPPSVDILGEPFLSVGIFEISLMEQTVFLEFSTLPTFGGWSLFSVPASTRPFIIEYMVNHFPVLHGREHLWSLIDVYRRRNKKHTLSALLTPSKNVSVKDITEGFLPIPVSFQLDNFFCDAILHVDSSFSFESLGKALQLIPPSSSFYYDYDVPLSLCFGSTTLPLEDVRQLEHGDVLLVETPLIVR